MLKFRKPVKFFSEQRSKTVKVPLLYIEAIPKFMGVGQKKCLSTATLLSKIGKTDSDNNRRMFRLAVEYYQLVKGVCIVSTTEGYWVAGNRREQRMGSQHRRKEAQNIIARAEELDAMDVQQSLTNWGRELTDA